MNEKIIVPKMEGLEFDELSHIYLLNGVALPSVTKIIEVGNDTYKDVDKNVLDRAANRGTAVHNSIENWIKFGVDDLEPDMHGYLDAFMDWWDMWKPKIIGSEVRLYHKLMRYAGTCDLLAEIEDEINLIDFKTSYKVYEKNCRLQLEAYSQAMASHGLVVKRKRILHLKKDGKWEDIQFDQRDAEAWRVFSWKKGVYDWEQS